jgi:hypothetical protein
MTLQQIAQAYYDDRRREGFSPWKALLRTRRMLQRMGERDQAIDAVLDEMMETVTPEETL